MGSWGRHGLHTRGRGAARGCDAELGSGHGHAAVGMEPGRAWAGRRVHGWPPSCAAECAWGQTRLASQAPALSPGHSVPFPVLQLENGYNPGDPSLPPSRGGRSGRRTRLPNRARPQVSGCGGIPASAEGGLTPSVTGGLSETHVYLGTWAAGLRAASIRPGTPPCRPPPGLLGGEGAAGRGQPLWGGPRTNPDPAGPRGGSLPTLLTAPHRTPPPRGPWPSLLLPQGYRNRSLCGLLGGGAEAVLRPPRPLPPSPLATVGGPAPSPCSGEGRKQPAAPLVSGGLGFACHSQPLCERHLCYFPPGDLHSTEG